MKTARQKSPNVPFPVDHIAHTIGLFFRVCCSRLALCKYKIIYFSMCIAALTIYSMQRLRLPLNAVVNNYVNDFLCLPILFGGISFGIRYLKKDAHFRLPFIFIIGMAAYYAAYFEYYLPQFNPRYTGDWIDVALYFLGGLSFFYAESFRNPTSSHTHSIPIHNQKL